VRSFDSEEKPALESFQTLIGGRTAVQGLGGLGALVQVPEVLKTGGLVSKNEH